MPRLGRALGRDTCRREQLGMKGVDGMSGLKIAQRPTAANEFGLEVGEWTCGTLDVVTLQNGKVVDAIVRWPGHGYEGQSTSPTSIPWIPLGRGPLIRDTCSRSERNGSRRPPGS